MITLVDNAFVWWLSPGHVENPRPVKRINEIRNVPSFHLNDVPLILLRSCVYIKNIWWLFTLLVPVFKKTWRWCITFQKRSRYMKIYVRLTKYITKVMLWPRFAYFFIHKWLATVIFEIMTFKKCKLQIILNNTVNSLFIIRF